MRNMDLAKRVLPQGGWSACEVEGRALQKEDLDSFVALGKDDPEFVWERKQQGVGYFDGLLQFRLGHYWKYGFGVHGLWEHGKLVGQCGLQVLSDERDQVEFVIFLGGSARGRGLGKCLSSYLIQRCQEEGMSDLYGVVRRDNPEGTKMITRAGGQIVEPAVKHFGQLANVYRVHLARPRG